MRVRVWHVREEALVVEDRVTPVCVRVCACACVCARARAGGFRSVSLGHRVCSVIATWVVRGKHDFLGLKNRKQAHSKYGSKKPK